MNCEFCKKIWNSKEEYTKQFTYPYDENVAIVLDEEHCGKPSLYIPIEDYYYSGVYLQMNYCPKCGRKLTEDTTTLLTHDVNQWLFSDLDDTIDCF